jgi:hypothetical protein
MQGLKYENSEREERFSKALNEQKNPSQMTIEEIEAELGR